MIHRTLMMFTIGLMSVLYIVQTHALADVCFTKGLWTVDEMRRGIEGLPPAAYRWAAGRLGRKSSVHCAASGIMVPEDLLIPRCAQRTHAV